MKRIAIRLVSLASLGLLGFGFVSACASEESAFQSNGADASVVVGTGGAGAVDPGAGGAPAETPSCTSTPPNPGFCPSPMSGMGTPCCMPDGNCGNDFGMGCVAGTAAAPPDGG